MPVLPPTRPASRSLSCTLEGERQTPPPEVSKGSNGVTCGSHRGLGGPQRGEARVLVWGSDGEI